MHSTSRPFGLLATMSSNYYGRTPLPHEDDATFKRVLKNISTQEAMPRPSATGFDELSPQRYSELLGDTWHFDDIGLKGWTQVVLRTAIYGGVSSTEGKNWLFTLILEI